MDPLLKNEPSPFKHLTFFNIPDEINLFTISYLKNLQDINSFTEISHAALLLRSRIWFGLAKSFGYTGNLQESQKFLQIFFSKISKIAEIDMFPREWKVISSTNLQKKEVINGYLTTEKILNASLLELKLFLNNRWVYHIPELLLLTRKASDPYFKEVLNPYYIKTELLNPAAKLGKLSQIKILCKIVDNPNLSDMEYAPIHAAAHTGQGNAIRILIKNGASIDALWRKNALESTTYTFFMITHHYTPLNLAYKSNSVDAVRALLEAKASPDEDFLKACLNAHINMLKVFLEFTYTYPLNEGLEYCFQNNEPIALSCVKLLLHRGADVNKTNNNRETLLYRSVKKGDLNFTRLFCTHGANLEIRNTSGESPLYIAIKGYTPKVSRLAIIQILCESGADIHALDPAGKKTLLQHASKSKKISTLLKKIDGTR